MDPEAVAFLRRIVKTLTIGFIWLALTCTFAIKGDNAFISGSLRLGNILFYIWFIVSVVTLVFIYKKLWGSVLKFNEKENEIEY